MPTVHTLLEADIWFRENHSGNVLCQKPDGSTLEVCCYPEAKAFFES